MKKGVLCGLRYLTRYPENFDPSKKYPTLLFLHGAGTIGNDLDKLAGNPFFEHVEKLNLPCVIFSPQCNEGKVWFDLFERLEDFARTVLEFDFVDKERYYVVGASMGGYATWQLAMSLNDIFAAAIPICGGGIYWNAGRLKNTPVWAFHGENDPTVFCEDSVQMVEAINKRGGNAKLTIYPNTDHNSWDPTYGNPEVWEWLFSQRFGKKDVSGGDAEAMDSKRFG
ncbi:MAG: prolyl oligopeptidase family serine peptidase [Clostridia bacterium]|nr:prolyl oligopeptidase family serine peptidase [Clostridia bacterium]